MKQLPMLRQHSKTPVIVLGIHLQFQTFTPADFFFFKPPEPPSEPPRTLFQDEVTADHILDEYVWDPPSI
jgi:hypothetical protein